jgi:hypothetical protein
MPRLPRIAVLAITPATRPMTIHAMMLRPVDGVSFRRRTVPRKSSGRSDAHPRISRVALPRSGATPSAYAPSPWHAKAISQLALRPVA